MAARRMPEQPSPTAQARLEADRQVVAALASEGFDGRLWSLLAEDLAGYGYQVLVAWMRSGKVFSRFRERRVRGRLRPPPGGPALGAEVASDLAVESVALAIDAFREKLRAGEWRPERGASLKTYFVGQCLFKLGTVYRRWLRTVESELRLESPAPIDEAAVPLNGAGQAGDPAEVAVQRDETRRRLVALNPRARFIVLSLYEGYTQAEIAELLRVSVATVEREIARWRRGGQLANDRTGLHMRGGAHEPA
jgi:RNA polymerase sigma factor (sigma-70 family)